VRVRMVYTIREYMTEWLGVCVCVCSMAVCVCVCVCVRLRGSLDLVRVRMVYTIREYMMCAVRIIAGGMHACMHARTHSHTRAHVHTPSVGEEREVMTHKVLSGFN